MGLAGAGQGCAGVAHMVGRRCPCRVGRSRPSGVAGAASGAGGAARGASRVGHGLGRSRQGVARSRPCGRPELSPCASHRPEPPVGTPDPARSRPRVFPAREVQAGRLNCATQRRCNTYMCAHRATDRCPQPGRRVHLRGQFLRARRCARAGRPAPCSDRALWTPQHRQNSWKHVGPSSARAHPAPRTRRKVEAQRPQLRIVAQPSQWVNTSCEARAGQPLGSAPGTFTGGRSGWPWSGWKSGARVVQEFARKWHSRLAMSVARATRKSYSPHVVPEG